MNDFQNTLNKAKIKLNMTGAEFAVLIDTKIDTYRKWSQGRATPNEEIQERVLEAIKKALSKLS